MNRFVKFARNFAKGMAMLSPNCKQVTRLQSEALDHELPTLQRAGLRVHVLFCRWCRRYGKQIHFLRDAAHEHPDELVEPVSQKLSNEARERIKQRLRSEEK